LGLKVTKPRFELRTGLWFQDDALREILTNSSTVNFITHTVLLSKNTLGQTLLTLIEVNFYEEFS
jgi:hypothetical protein